MKHVMIDLETMGITPQAPIVSIGAILFDPNLNKLGNKKNNETFYEELDYSEQDRKPCQSTVDWWNTQSTVDWWNTQSEAAKNALGGLEDLPDVLIKLAKFIPKNAKVWGNGSTFDIAMLEDAYRQYDMEIPWAFWNVRDCRTVVDMFETQRGGLGQNRKANNHNALDDATNQAKYIIKMWRKLVFGK